MGRCPERCPGCGLLWEVHSNRCKEGWPGVDLHGELAGEVISKHHIVGRIGKGGMGTVYLAWDANLEKFRAVKVLLEQKSIARSEMERLFKREAQLADNINHPNVCRIYGYKDPDPESDLALLVMELVRGRSLGELLRDRHGVLELSEAARIVREVADGLEAIHSENIVHRDIKPSNIIVTAGGCGTGHAKIVDFGIARMADEAPSRISFSAPYSSPEQLRGEAAGKQSDIYSLGVVLFEMLTGRTVSEASSSAERQAGILGHRVKPPKLKEVRPDLTYPPAVQRVVSQALAHDPLKRFANATEFSNALIESLANNGSRPWWESLEGWIRRSCSPLRLGGALAVATLSGVALLLALGGLDSCWPHPMTLHVEPPEALLRSGDSLRLVVEARNDKGRTVSGLEFRWISQDPEVARVSSTGLVTGRLVGATSIFAVAGSDTARSEVAVAPGPAVRLSLQPESLSLQVGRSERLMADVTDTYGNSISQISLAWSSAAPEVAAVDSGGLVTARRPGTSVVGAEAGEARGQVIVVVSSPPDLCPAPVMATLEGLDTARIRDPTASRQRLRDRALACWNRGSALSTQERAYAAWLVGSFTFDMEGCSANTVQWLERAVNLDPGSESYRVLLAACGN